MATAAAALRLLRRRAAAPASPMLRSLFPGLHSKAAAAFLPTVSRLHVAPPLAQPYLLRRYSSKGTDGTAATDIPGTGRVNQLKAIGQLELLVGDLAEQRTRMHKAAVTCREAVRLLSDDPDKASALWEEGWDDLMRSAAMYRYCIDGIAKATASIKGTPLDVVLEQNQVCSEFVEHYARTTREFCTTVEDFLSTSRNYMKKLSSEREKLETLQMIAKGLATLTLGISLLVLLPLMGIYLAGTLS